MAHPSGSCRAIGCVQEHEGDEMTELPRSLPEFEARFPDLSLRWSENGLEFRRHTSSLRTRVGWRVPTSLLGGASADGEDRFGGGDLELLEDLGELGADGRGLDDGPALARVADGLEPLQG